MTFLLKITNFIFQSLKIKAQDHWQHTYFIYLFTRQEIFG
jgi:hypothetical protein